MIQVRAQITLYKDHGRRTPFVSGYRPLFMFVPEMKKSGQIKLTDRKAFVPGGHGVVEILFVDKDYLGLDFGVGKRFTFGEGGRELGEGEIIEIISSRDER